MLTAVGLSLLIGVPLGVIAGPLGSIPPRAQPVPGRGTDHPRLRVPDAGRALLLDRLCRGGRCDDDLRHSPCVRITALGIRGVPMNTVEAAASMGSTRRQMLQKVQLPLSRRMLLLGVNQTILFALSMVVIAGLIGGGGLGAVVNSGLYTNPALAMLAGIVIVIMAMTLDRVTERIADRTDPTKRHLDEAEKRRMRRVPWVARRDRRHGRRWRRSSAPAATSRTPRACDSGGDALRRACSARSSGSSTTSRIRPRSSSGSPNRPETSSSPSC